MLSIIDTVRDRFRQQYKEAPVDLASFHRPYKACSMSDCNALCCSGGSGFYYDEEPETIRRVTAENPEFFAKAGVPLPGKLFDEEVDEETGKVELSTNTRTITYPPGVLPKHFDSTACIFRAPTGACALQMLSVEQGHDSWHYKPVACWLFPIELEADGEPLIRVASHETDEYIDDEYPGFVGFVGCGEDCKTVGKPAYQSLEKEIAVLSEWLGRDLLQEIIAYGNERRSA